MRTSVGPDTEATTLTGPKEKLALASDLARVPNSAESGRIAVGEVLLDEDAVVAAILNAESVLWHWSDDDRGEPRRNEKQTNLSKKL